MQNEYAFSRREKKYILREHDAQALKRALMPFLERETTSEGNHISWRRSYYFETRDLKSYFDHRNRRSNRYKIRFRFYDPTTTMPKYGFLEIKRKCRGQITKNRIQFDSSKTHTLLKGRDWYPVLAPLNSDLDPRSMIQYTNEMRQTIESLKMQVILSVFYARECLFDKDLGVRITFDTDLRVQAIRNTLIRPERNLARGPANNVIVEIKESKDRPEWLNRIIRDFGLKKQPFSKYCFGVESLYFNAESEFDPFEKNPIKEQKGVMSYAGISDEFIQRASIT